MGEISQTLLDFKDSVNGNTDGMNKTCTDIIDILTTLSQASNTAKTGFSNYYKSKNKDTILDVFSATVEVQDKIKESVGSVLSPLIGEAISLLADIKSLEDINIVIGQNQQVINNNSGDSPENVRRRNAASQEITTQNNKFNELHSSALSKLDGMKSKDGSIDLGDGDAQASAGETSTLNSSDIVTSFGTFSSGSYKASNGVTVNYYVYIPKVEEGTSKLSTLIYFHGVGDTIDKNSDRGLPGLIKNQEVNPKGIVIFPQATGNTKDIDFCYKEYEEAVLEFTYKVVDENNGDRKKISVSGHSNGGTAAYKMVNNFPNTFAACAPIAGVGNTQDGVMATNLWAFQGSQDPLVKPETGLRVAKRCISMGLNNADYYVYPGKGHDIQTLVFQDTFEDKDGNQTTLLDWLDAQSL